MNFLSPDQIQSLRAEYGTPLYVYDQRRLENAAREALAFPSAHGLTARYAMKALPTAAVVRIFSKLGLHIDASSGFEAQRALLAGVPGEHIQISAQELPQDLKGLVSQGVRFNACSLEQLEAYARLFPGGEVSVRINPGLGTGHNNRTNTGGTASSFGIWHEHLEKVKAIQERTNLRITRMHTHIGSGGDPETWKRCALLSMGVAAQLPEVTTLNLGGGFKVGRMPGEISADLQEIGNALLDDFREFEREHGRALHLEIEPGTYLVAGAGAIIATVTDVVDTGSEGYTFAKVDTGMTEFLRPNLYGAQHPIGLFPSDPEAEREEIDVLVAGHCCESGDMMTPRPATRKVLPPGDCRARFPATRWSSAAPAPTARVWRRATTILFPRRPRS